MRLVGLLYPILFAASLVLGVAAHGAGQYRGSDLALVLTVVVLATAITIAIVFAIVRSVERTDRSVPLAGVLSMVIVAWFFYYGPAQAAAERITWRGSRNAVLIPLGVIVTIGMLAWLLRQPRARLIAVNSFMTRFGAVLVALLALELAFSGARRPSAAKGSTLVRQLAQPIRVDRTTPVDRNAPKRDVYLIILDGHANGRVLREVLHYDDTQFEDSLRALGFVIPREMHSNYTQTILSLSSLLNASHVTQLTKDAGETNASFALPAHLIEYNRVARFLKGRGYKYVLFPSLWWKPTQYSPIADVVFDAQPEFSLANAIRRTELRLAVRNSTLLRFVPEPRVDALFEVRKMVGLRGMPAERTPTFVLAHFLMPHSPYYLDASCHPLKQAIHAVVEDASPEQRAAYVGQVRCADNMVLDVVTTLLRDSRPAPVIAIVGDHGSRFSDPRYYERPDNQSTAFIRERFGAFGAFYMPAGGDSAFTGSVTLVNVMRNVLRHYFNAELQPNPDAMYISGQLPYRFYRVDSTGYLGRSSAGSAVAAQAGMDSTSRGR